MLHKQQYTIVTHKTVHSSAGNHDQPEHWKGGYRWQEMRVRTFGNNQGQAKKAGMHRAVHGKVAEDMCGGQPYYFWIDTSYFTWSNMHVQYITS